MSSGKSEASISFGFLSSSGIFVGGFFEKRFSARARDKHFEQQKKYLEPFLSFSK